LGDIEVGNIKTNRRSIGCEVGTTLIWLGIASRELDNEPSRSVEDGEFFDQLRDCIFAKAAH
jgi:hypothetical protein